MCTWRANSCAFDCLIEIFNILPIKRLKGLETAAIPGISFIQQSQAARTSNDLQNLQKEMMAYIEEQSAWKPGNFHCPTTLLEFFFPAQLNINQKEADLITSVVYNQWQGILTCPNPACVAWKKEAIVTEISPWELIFGVENEYPNPTILEASFSVKCPTCKQKSPEFCGKKHLLSFPNILVCQVSPSATTAKAILAPPMKVKVSSNINIHYNLVGAIARVPKHYYCFVSYEGQWLQIDPLNKKFNVIQCIDSLPNLFYDPEDLLKLTGYELLFYVRRE